MSDRTFDPTTSGTQSSTKDVAADEAKSVAQDAQQGGKHVATTAKDEAQQVAGEAKGHAQDLFHQVRSEAGSQASTQQQRAADGLRSLSGELGQMASGADSGVASNLVSQAAGQVDKAAGWLADREPGDLLDDVKRYARRNPGTFLAAAAAIGLIGGRLTRGLQSDAQRSTQRSTQRSQGEWNDTARTGYARTTYAEDVAPSYATPATYPADTGYGEPAIRPTAPTPSPSQGFGDDQRGLGDVRR